MASTIAFRLNGKIVETRSRPDQTVLDWLRLEAGLKGTKEGCAEGDCGACTILLGRTVSGELRVSAANSCILLMGQVAGCSILTIEGLGDRQTGLHPVQRAMARNGSSQCGFCTPGIALALAALADRDDEPDNDAIHDALAGNLCRCTGYRPIVEAAKNAAMSVKRGDLAGSMPAPTADSDRHSSVLEADGSEFIAPTNLTDLVNLRAEYPEAIVLGGGTDINLRASQGRERLPRILHTAKVLEMNELTVGDEEIRIGGAVSYERLLPVLESEYPSFAQLVRRFGSTQIRSMGTLAGNIGTASPIGDGAPALLALEGRLELASRSETRVVDIADFFTGYRQTLLRDDEIIATVVLPRPRPGSAFRVYKISKRYDQDISTVCGAFNLALNSGIVTYARVAFGGMAETPARCEAAEQALIGRPFDQTTVDAAAAAIRDTFTPMDDVRGTAAYRSLVAGNLLHRFKHDVTGDAPVEVMAL